MICTRPLLTVLFQIGILSLANAEPIRLNSGVHLFIDDRLIETSEGTRRTTRSPIPYGQPVVGLEHSPWQPYITVLRDEETGKFRMWYNAHTGGKSPDNFLAYLESDDGIHWPGPHKKLLPVPGFCASVIDEGPGFTPPDQRYKCAYFGLDGDERKYIPSREDVRSGVYVATSPDGLDWTEFEENPVLPFYWAVYRGDFYSDRSTPEEMEVFAGLRAFCANDIINVYKDPFLGGYGLHCKMMSRNRDEFGMTSRTAEEGVRLVGRSHSDDFFRWRIPERLFVPDNRDEGVFEFYGMSVHPHDNMLIGMVKVLRDDLPAIPGGEVGGIGYTSLAISHDGSTWTRYRERFMDRHNEPSSWDNAHIWIDDILEVGDETYFYYGGYKGGHKANRYTDRLIGLARMRKDGYVSRDSTGPSPGEIVMKPVVFDARKMSLNVNASEGAVRVEIRDRMGDPIEGFAFDGCEPIVADSVSAPVRFAGDFSRLSGREARIAFEVRDARLYGIELE